MISAPGDENPQAIDVAAMLGPDVRKEVIRLGFVEWVAANLGALSTQSANLSLNIMYAMVDEPEDQEVDENWATEFRPKQRFLCSGGVAALDAGLVKDVALLEADDEAFDDAHALLAFRLASNLMLNDDAMAAAFGESGVLASAGAILQKAREAYFDADEPMPEDREQLVLCTIEFVSMFVDLLPNQRLLLEEHADIVDCVLNYLEHAALGETNLVPSDEFRTVCLNVLVSGLDTESSEPKAQQLFAKYLVGHESAVETLIELLEQGGADPEDADDEDAAYAAAERAEQEAPTITDILTQLGGSRAGAEALVKKSVDKKMYGIFDAARAAAEQAEDEEEQNAAFDRMEKALAVLGKLAVLPQV